MAVTKAALDKVVSELKEGCADVKDALKQRGPFRILKAIVKAVPSIISKVEEVSKTLGLKGADKKELALDIIMLLIGPKLPWWARWVPIREILGAVIDMMIEMLNKKLGKKWAAK